MPSHVALHASTKLCAQRKWRRWNIIHRHSPAILLDCWSWCVMRPFSVSSWRDSCCCCLSESKHGNRRLGRDVRVTQRSVKEISTKPTCNTDSRDTSTPGSRSIKQARSSTAFDMPSLHVSERFLVNDETQMCGFAKNLKIAPAFAWECSSAA